MHASVGRRRGGFEQCSEATRFASNDFALINDHSLLLKGQDKSMIYPATFSTKPRLMNGDIRNSIGYHDRTISKSCGKVPVYPQTHKKDITTPISEEPSLFSAVEYTGINSVSDISSSQGNTKRKQDELNSKGKDLLYCDWPELDNLDDFDSNLRNLYSTFEIGRNYFEDSIWYSICSPDVQLVPSSCFFDNRNLSTVTNESTSNPIAKSLAAIPDTTSTESVVLDQIDLANPIQIQPPSRNSGGETPLNCEAYASSSGQIEKFSQNSDFDLFCPFDDLPSTPCISSCEGLEDIVGSNHERIISTASRMMCNDEIASSSTCSGPDLVAAYASCSTKKSPDPLNGTPDMVLDGMAQNPLEIYFPALRTYVQPELLMSGNSAQIHRYPEDFPGKDVMNSAGLQFCSKKRTSEPCVSPPSPLVLEAVPVKDLGFQKLQESMNQLNVATKTCIRDALYRLASCVEQRHYAGATTDGVEQLTTTSTTVEPSGSKRFKPSRWTETQQTGALDLSVAQLLLRKPMHRKTGVPHPPRHASHAVT